MEKDFIYSPTPSSSPSTDDSSVERVMPIDSLHDRILCVPKRQRYARELSRARESVVTHSSRPAQRSEACAKLGSISRLCLSEQASFTKAVRQFLRLPVERIFNHRLAHFFREREKLELFPAIFS